MHPVARLAVCLAFRIILLRRRGKTRNRLFHTLPRRSLMKCYSNIHLNTDSMIEEEEDEDLILTEDLEDDAPAAPMAEAPVEEPSAEEEKPMLDFDFEEMIPSKDDTEE